MAHRTLISMRTADFHYELPEGAIAQAAVEPRDGARLLDTRDMSDHRFRDLPSRLQPGDLVVVNSTRVRPVRLHGVKEGSGGRVEALLLRARGDGAWEALVRPARRLRAGVRIRFGDLLAVVTEHPAAGQTVLAAVEGSFAGAMEAVGEVPLPPYFHGHLDDPERYQTIYADRPGSAAAPTAGLHFTEAVLRGLEERGITRTAIDLEIGLDTFRPISEALLEDHPMHRERTRVGEDASRAIAAARERGGRVVAIGTTVVRALESAGVGGGLVRPGETDTSLFIAPGYDFTVVDLLVTNFHVPASTLVVLVAAFMGTGWRDAYAAALTRGYRFLSFGDSMLAERRV